MPWMLDCWEEIIAAVSTTEAAPPGRSSAAGASHPRPTGWTTAPSEAIAPRTVGAQTVTQTATGLNTRTNQNVLVCATIATNTGLTSVTTDELTCELIG